MIAESHSIDCRYIQYCPVFAVGWMRAFVGRSLTSFQVDPGGWGHPSWAVACPLDITQKLAVG